MVNSSNSGVWPVSSHPPGLRMCATLAAEVFELTRPMYSSISLGLLPAASMRVGCVIRVGMDEASSVVLMIREYTESYGHGYGVPGVGGVPGITVGGPGTPSAPGAPEITVGGVPGVQGG